MTISEIAKLAGVSAAAVSRYFNDGYVSDEKREAIAKVVEETGYRPSISAQMLRTGRTRTVGVIIPKIDSSSIGKVVAGVSSVLEKKGYRMLLANTDNSPKKEMEYLSVFGDQQVDGIILLATEFSKSMKKALKETKVPVVLTGQRLGGYNCICHNDRAACRELTKTIISHGRKNIGFIGVTMQDEAVGRERYRGYCEALEEAGLSACADQMTISLFNIKSGYACAKELLEKYPDLDAMICATDTIAVGAFLYLREKGVQQPKDLLLSGMGDSGMSLVCDPPLTTVHYYYEEAGKTSAKRLIELIDDNDRTPQEIRLGYEVIDRADGSIDAKWYLGVTKDSEPDAAAKRGL